MKTITPFDLGRYLCGFRERAQDGMLTVREAQIVDRLTDDELSTVDIKSVVFCVWLQHGGTPIGDIPQGWWGAVVEGAQLVPDGRMGA